MIQLGCCLTGGSFMPQGVGAVEESAARKLMEEAEFAIQTGYDYTETSAGVLSSLEEPDLRMLEENGNRIRLRACNSFIPGSLSLWNPAQREQLEEYVDRILSICTRLGIEVMVFGSGKARRLPEGMGLEEGHAGIIAFLQMCSRYAEKYGVTVAIEPLNRDECNVLTTVAEGAAVIRRLNRPRIRLLADAYHTYREQEDLSVLTAQAELLCHIHVAEPPARVYPGRDGGAYLRKFAGYLRQAGYDGRVSVECGYQDFRADIQAAYGFLREVLR